ncbi:MAG: alpha/beta fold hydrolase [Alistipes sp.]|nr:alpha/beta fold hydrolase [Alistipes sp.]
MEKFLLAHHTALRISDSQKGAPTLVLLHGYMESIEIWDEFMPLLTPQFRIVAIDIPGHGISQVQGEIHTMEFVADVLHEVLHKEQIDRCFVAGHSMGGYIAEAFAVKYPECVEGLILLHSTPNADTPEKQHDRMREIEMVQCQKKDLIAKLFAARSFAAANRKPLADRIEQLQELMMLTEDEGVIALLRGMAARPDQNAALRALSIPQLFLFGREDELIPMETAQALAAAHPQAEVVYLEHSGHMGFIEEPEATAEILRAFMLRHTDSRAPRI